ncbi:hypothetical protein [Pantoea sp. NGS-ED-1003]|uniref:hypothetical protein n=1 Tax=Pantoea sp. NGS-ED-1003 TaxID=1526743 RepID=UPI00068E2EF6|nr:hypothetical protein [Pantoea sp. NGS-ED-1003]
MSNKNGPLHIAICDDGYRLSTSSGEASYTLDGIPTLKMGIVDNLPDKLTITDRRSLPSAINVSAVPTPWGAKVEWKWPKEAEISWYAVIRAEYSDGDDPTYQAGKAEFPDCAYKVTGVPAGKDISLTVTLHDGNGKRSRPAQLSIKSSGDAATMLCNTFKIIGGQAFINEALIGPYKQSQVGSFHCNNGEIKYCAGNNSHDVRMRVGVNAGESRDKDEHAPVTLADCKARFGDDHPLPFGGFPMPKRKVRINIAGLHEWKDGILAGAEVRVDIIQSGKCIHSEVFSGKATQPFSREVDINASFDDIVAVHNRPDLKELKVSAEFADVASGEESADRLTKIISEQVRQRLNKELQPGGLLHKR